MLTTIVQFLHMDKLLSAKDGIAQVQEFLRSPNVTTDSDMTTAVAVVSDILMLVRHSLSSVGVPHDHGEQGQSMTSGTGRFKVTDADVPESVSKVWEQKAISVRLFLEDWDWRLLVLHRLRPSLKPHWHWKEALSVLRASPSTLLNM
jgi:hypothetical protein